MFSTLRGLPATVRTLFAGTIINRIGCMVTPFLVFFLASRGITGAETSLILGALGAGGLLGPAVGGLLADRIGRRPTMLIGLVGTAAAQGALFLAPGVALMATAALLVSATNAMVSPAVYALMADSVEGPHRRQAYALFGWGINIGTSIAGVLGGFLAAHGYWLLFAVDAASMLAYALVVATRLRETRPAKGKGHGADATGVVAAEATATGGPEAAAAAGAAGAAATGAGAGVKGAGGAGVGYGIVVRDRLMLLVLPVLGVQSFVYALTEAALPLAISGSGLSPTVYGTLGAVNAALVVLLQPLVTTRLAHLPQLSVHAAGSVLVAVGVAMTGLADGVAGYVVSVVVWSLGEVVVAGISATVISHLAPPHARGRYQGALNWTWGVARFTALTVGVLLYTAAGPAVLWWTALVAGVTASALSLGLARRVTARTRHALAA
ncbi:MFS transporter [Streptomyces sp. NPDC056600]|uniref:MFS transporter n=1 Tax=Streptomyces sp. NPDC056600 TaxID=3345874 RepID=UPI00368B9B42